MKNRYEKEHFTNIVKNSINLTDVAKNIGLSAHCGNRQTIKKYIEIYKLDVGHFKHGGKINRKQYKLKYELSEILIENSLYGDTHKLKNRLYKEGLKERKCEKCGQNELWNGEKMSLILDHINGVHTDNRIENLRIVCPNCNATLPTHGGKNIKEGKYKYKSVNKNKICVCGNKKDIKAKLCKKCHDLTQRKAQRPTYKDLLYDIENLGYSGTGRKYDVSDSSIRKWVKQYVEDYGIKQEINLENKEKHKSHNSNQRKVKDRPPYIQLFGEIKEFGYTGTGRIYGVSDNTIRKWKKYYEKYNIVCEV